MLTCWKKVLSNGTTELHIQKGFEWGNALTCNTIESVDGHIISDGDIECFVTARRAGQNIVEGYDTPVEIQVTIDCTTRLGGRECIFNTYFPAGAPISQLTDALHEQDLEDLEYAIYHDYVEDATWGTYSPLTDDEHRARGYVEITRQEAEALAQLAGCELREADWEEPATQPPPAPKMKINFLARRFADEVILYAPELELPEAQTVAEKCYPALGCLPSNPIDASRFFYLLDSEIGEYAEHKNHPARNSILHHWGREKIEAKFRQMASAILERAEDEAKS